jgi:pantoate ligase/cytidylate kinase
VRLFTTVAGLRRYLELHRLKPGLSQQGQRDVGIDLTEAAQSVGLVPTMGALHAGHLSLVRRARRENQIVVVSIFVNPLQFGPNEDFQRYPRTLESDRQICEEAGVDVIFAPAPSELYETDQSIQGDRLTQVIPPAEMISGLCGRSRPGHFEGVATIVTKLLNLVQPNRAYFGQKDAQQLAILKRVVSDLNIPVEIVACPIVREENGLALSSRNQYLSSTEKQQATVLYRSLKRAESLFSKGQCDRSSLLDVVRAEIATVPSVQLEYAELVHPISMTPLDYVEDAGLLAIAAHIGSTRLIDNIVLRRRQPIIAIDGPAGAGKSTVARLVAQHLHLLYLDSGAMYRAITWFVLQSETAIDDEAGIAELTSQCQIRLTEDSEPRETSSSIPASCQVWVNGQNVTQAIRSPEVTANVSAIAAQPAVRRELVKQQQEYGRRGGVVMDGRDIGTYVFPNAELKIFLTASVQERARRRQQDLKNMGQAEVSLEDLEHSIYQRDFKDSTRSISPLRKAADAIEIQTDALTIEDVTDKIIGLFESKQPKN